MNILLVDDKKTVLSSISAFLEDEGHDVTTALNGLQAFEQTHVDDFDLFIIDHLMPVMDGIQLAKRLKKQDQTADLPILFMSTQDIKSIEHLAENQFVDHLLSKPINFEKLAELLKGYTTKNSVNLSL